jgi:predicted nucleic acid-binding protein
MIVVSDTSAITALLQIGCVEFLSRIYGEVFIPSEVARELACSHPVLPLFIRTIPVAQPSNCLRLLDWVDAGEAEAIVLAKELKADELLMDDPAGRRVAVAEGLKVVGLLGVILMARQRGFVSSVRVVLDELESKAGFFVSEPVRNLILREASEL